MALTEYEMRAGVDISCQRLEQWQNHDNGQQMSLASMKWRSRAEASLLLACTKAGSEMLYDSVCGQVQV